MRKRMIVIVAVIAVVLTGLVGFFLFPTRSDEPPKPEETTFVDLGVTYLPVTARLSAYYDLGVESGVLVTEVKPNSIAEKAGVRVGDVILSFNGASLSGGDSLIGMMRGCPTGNRIVLEVCRDKSSQAIEFVHTPNR